MDERILAAVEGDEAYCVGGAIRDELLGRPVLDTDVACREPEAAAQRLGGLTKSAAFLLSERHGAWRVAFRDGRTVDFTLLKGDIQADLGGRDFTVNAIAVPLPAGEPIDPFGGRSDLEFHRLRAVYDRAFTDDPLRLLRAARLEDELELRIDPATEGLIRRDAHLVAEPAGERVLAELLRLSDAGWRRLGELGLLAGLGGSIARLGVVEPGASAELRLVAALGDAVFALPLSNELRRFARKLLAANPPADDSPRAIHRFRRTTEPWALDALAFVDARGLAPAVERARAAEPAEPLLHGDELGVESGPEIGRLLERIAEERAAGTISTREEALELVRRERR
jgi:tRNA nucleotidyltransferase/poly(A) polymerase